MSWLWQSKASAARQPAVEKQAELDAGDQFLFDSDEERSVHGRRRSSGAAPSTSGGGDDSMHRRREMAKRKRGQSHMLSVREAVIQLAGILSPTVFFEHKVCFVEHLPLAFVLACAFGAYDVSMAAAASTI